jgi:hypothetical protein
MLKRWWGRHASPEIPVKAGDVVPPARTAGPAPRTEEDEQLLDRISAGVVRYGMTVPAIFFLESSKPLSFVGGQFLHFLSPIVHSLFDAREIDRLASLLERRDTHEELIVRIERDDSTSSPRSTERASRRKP